MSLYFLSYPTPCVFRGTELKKKNRLYNLKPVHNDSSIEMQKRHDIAKQLAQPNVFKSQDKSQNTGIAIIVCIAHNLHECKG